MANPPDTLANEEWRDVPGHEGRYQASSAGRIKRLARLVSARSGGSRLLEEAIIGGHTNRRGYVNIKIEGRSVEAHRMVCAAFHGPPPSAKHHAAHANDIKNDNRADNLRWATAKENARDRIDNGLQARGEAISSGKLTEAQVREIRERHTGAYGEIKALAEEYGVRSENIIAITKRRSWKHID